MTLRLIVHAAKEDAAWHAKATSFVGVVTLTITIGSTEVVVFIRGDQVQAADVVARSINAAFGPATPNPKGAPCGA